MDSWECTSFLTIFSIALLWAGRAEKRFRGANCAPLRRAFDAVRQGPGSMWVGR